MSRPEPTATEQDAHDPAVIVRELSAQQAARSRHVCVMLGAGTSKAAGVPDLHELGIAVRKEIEPSYKVAVPPLFENRNLEDVLTRVRRLSTILEPGQKLDELSSEKARALEAEITNSIISVIGEASTDPEVFDGLAAWAAHQDRLAAVELFTLNYDLLIETALEKLGAAYFDGFIGHLRGRFRGDLVETDDPVAGLPPQFVRLWKLHGSVNWLIDDSLGAPSVVRLGAPAPSGSVAAIYPSDEKYADSRRVPFLVLHDRLRNSLHQSETMLLITGYSFGDQHLNEVIFEAALRNPRSQFVVFCHSSIPENLASRALVTPNLLVTASSEAIVGGRRRAWRGADVPDVFQGGEWKLGNFAALAKFLATGPGGGPVGE